MLRKSEGEDNIRKPQLMHYIQAEANGCENV